MAGGNAGAAQHSKHGDDGRRNNQYDTSNTLRLNEFYNMDNEYRGKALIFSHYIYNKHLRLNERSGNKKDWQRLEKCLKQLSFNVHVFHNLKYSKIMEHIEVTAKMDHSKNDCLLIVVLTHGQSHAYLYARDIHYRAENLWCPFTDENCPTLAGKPKLFIIQACQGDKYDDGITLKKNFTEADGSFEPHKVPFHRDFLLALSSVPGYLSWRNRDTGSWFIQELCEELEYLATTETDILTLLTSVSQKVALNHESYNEKNILISYKKAVPYFSSLLTRRLVFTKKPESSIIHEQGPSRRSEMTRAGNDSLTSSREQSFVGLLRACWGF